MTTGKPSGMYSKGSGGDRPSGQLKYEADAICAKCGMVNPEDTLVCRNCGNNLRDQRLHRMVRMDSADRSFLSMHGARWLKGALGALGILIVVWMAINADQVAELVNIFQAPAGSDAELFWTGESSAEYDELLAKLNENPITEEEKKTVLTNPSAVDTFDGRYVIVREEPVTGLTEIGQAFVRSEGNKLMFAAKLNRGAEIRGDAWIEGDGIPVVRESAAVRIDDGCYVILGLAARRQPGVYHCDGQSFFNDVRYTALAYRVPFPEERQAGK